MKRIIYCRRCAVIVNYLPISVFSSSCLLFDGGYETIHGVPSGLNTVGKRHAIARLAELDVLMELDAIKRQLRWM